MRRAVFGPSPEAHELDDSRRDPLDARCQGLDLALFDDLDDLLLDRLADPGQLLGASLDGELGDRAARLAHLLGRPPIGQRPELIAPFELEEVRQ